MPNLHEYVGLYYFFGLLFDVKVRDGQLIASMPGVPDGYEVILEMVGHDQFRNFGGPVDGSTLTFIRTESADVIAIKVGTFELVKISQEAFDTLPVTRRYPAPIFEATPEKLKHFEKLLHASLAQADGGWINYDLPYPKYEFVQYATSQDQIIFHGTNNLDIDEFLPLRKSMELHDESGRGNIQGVYGTHDGLWSMFFAIIDRQRLEGTIRNGVMYFKNQAGEQISIYNFSINQEQLNERPFASGALYFLPRDTFTRLHLTPESYANEWASQQPVKPIAKLRIQPEDFPFLEQIDGHDDSAIIRLNNMTAQIREAAIAAALQGDSFQVTLPGESQITSLLDEYIELQRVMMPAAQLQVESVGHDVKLIVNSLPPAVRQMLAAQYQDLLSNE
jgi:hypothetical protein